MMLDRPTMKVYTTLSTVCLIHLKIKPRNIIRLPNSYGGHHQGVRQRVKDKEDVNQLTC